MHPDGGKFGSGKTLLLVEDEALIALHQKKLLQEYGFQVISVYSGSEAITVSDREKIDIILMDIDLGRGRMDGTEAAAAILAVRELPIIFVSSHTEPEIVEKTEKITSYGYVVKNSGANVLVTSIKMAFRLFELKQEIQFSSQTSRDIVEAIPSGLFTYQYEEPGKLYLLEGNPEAERLTGIDNDTWRGKEFNEIWPAARETGITEAFLSAIYTGRRYETEELVYKDERLEAAYRVRAFPMPGKRLGVAFDEISELKKSRESLEVVLNSIPEDIYIVDMENYTVLFMNEQMRRSFPDADIGDPCYKVFRGNTSACDHCTNPQFLRETDTSQKVIQWECYNPVNKRWYLNYDRKIPWIEGKNVKLQIAADITERKQNEENLVQALHDKDALMQELNHRVKNNLSMISSLINLKDSALGHAVDLSDIIHQIEAISIIHEKLQQSNQIVEIELRDYIEDLLVTVFSTFSGGRVIINNEIEPVTLPTKTAITLGLLVNELATNAMKHGFTKNSESEFSLSMSKNPGGDLNIFTISNSGRPFPEEIDIKNTDTLGLRLVSILVEQIGGAVSIDREPEPVFTITFPAETTG